MANKDDYLAVYQRFFEHFAQTVNPNDQLPVKLASYKLVNLEVVGGVVDWTTQYLTQKQCPPSLLAPLIKTIIDEVRKSCKKNPINCGYNTTAEVYEPLKLMQAVMAKTNEVCLKYMDNSMLSSLPSPGPPHYVVTSAAMKNTRRTMEDRHVIVHDLNTMFNIQEASPSSYYAIFDGHAGHDAAVYSAVHLHQYLAESKHFVNNPEQALIDAFYKTDALFVDKEEFCSGTTAVCALLKPKERMLYIAWAGDSQALIVSKGVFYQCVVPHKPGREDEKDRIEQLGGVVEYWGTWRVNGHLAVSRAIGDRDYKPYVTAIPEVAEIPITANSDFLILACDGLWDFLPEEEAANTVYNMICTNTDDIDSISNQLVQRAKNQGSTDNISVIVVFLREPSKVAADAHWANRNTTTTMEAGLDNANAANNPFTNSNGAEIMASQKDDFLHNQPKEDFLLNITEGFKQNGGGAIASPNDVRFDNFEMNSGNRKQQRLPMDEFDEDEDMGPETDVDAVDDVASPMDHKQIEDAVQKLEAKEECEHLEGMARDETPTPPAVKGHDSVAGENVADSAEESEDEWNYFKGTSASTAAEPLSKTDRQPEATAGGRIVDQQQLLLAERFEEDEDDALDNALANDDDDEAEDMSQLNPNAAEFVPVSSPTRNVSSPACRALLDDEVIAQSPRRPAPQQDINVPNATEFESEVKSRPSEIYNNGHENENGHKLSSQEVMENLLNGKNLDEIEFHPTTPSNITSPHSDAFHFGPNAAPLFSTPAKRTQLDQSEAFSTKAEFGDESTASYLKGETLETTAIERDDSEEKSPSPAPKLTEQDPMSMSFYQDEDEHNPFDLNQVQQIPDNLEEFISGVENGEDKENLNPECSNEELLGVSQLPQTPEPTCPQELKLKEDVEKELELERIEHIPSPSLDEVAKQPLPITPEPTEVVKSALPISPEPTEVGEEAFAISPEPTEALSIATEPSEVVKEVLPITPEPTDVVKEALPITPEPTEVVKEPLSITPEPTDVIKEALPITPEPTEVVKEPLSITPEPTEVVKEVLPITPEPTEVKEALSITPEPTEVVKEALPITPEPTEVVKEALPITPEPTEVVKEALSITPEPREVVKEALPITPEPTEVVKEALPRTPEPMDVVHEPETTSEQNLNPVNQDLVDSSLETEEMSQISDVVDDIPPLSKSPEMTSDLDQFESNIKGVVLDACQITKNENLPISEPVVAVNLIEIPDLVQVEQKTDDLIEKFAEIKVDEKEEEKKEVPEPEESRVQEIIDKLTLTVKTDNKGDDLIEPNPETLPIEETEVKITEPELKIIESELIQPVQEDRQVLEQQQLKDLEESKSEDEIKFECDLNRIPEPTKEETCMSLTPEPSNELHLQQEENKASDEILRDLDSPMEDVTTSIKDDVSSSEIIEEAKDISTEKESFIAKESLDCSNDRILTLDEEKTVEASPVSVTDSEIIKTMEVPEMLSPMSAVTQLDDSLNQSKVESSILDVPEESEVKSDLVKTDFVIPQYPEETTIVATPSEESKPSVSEQEKAKETSAPILEAAAVGTGIAAATAAAITGVVVAAKPKQTKQVKEKVSTAEKKSPTKKLPAASSKTLSSTTRTTPSKASASSSKTSTTAKPAPVPKTTNLTPKRSSLPNGEQKPISKAPITKRSPLVTANGIQKKTPTLPKKSPAVPNEEQKNILKPSSSTVAQKKSPLPNATEQKNQLPKPASTVPVKRKLSPTYGKLGPAKTSPAPTEAPKRTVKQSYAAAKSPASPTAKPKPPATATAPKPTPTNLSTQSPGAAAKPTNLAAKTSATRTSTSSSRPTAATTLKARSVTATSASAKPTSMKPKAPDAQKQIKDTVNKQLTSSKGKTTTTTAPTKKPMNKITSTSHTTTKTSTTTAIKISGGKARPTALKPEATPREDHSTTTGASVTAVLETQLVKDLSPVENKFIIDEVATVAVEANNVAD